MLVYIRHSDDDHSPNNYVHDKSIDKEGKTNAKRKARKWMQKYGKPDIILCSPFRRTLETARIIRNTCGKNVPLYIDNNLSRYFCSSEKRNPQINPLTSQYDIPIFECKEDFEERIEKHLDFVQEYQHKKHITNIWCITHALVYKHIAKIYDNHLPKSIPFLHHFILYKI